MEESKKLYAVKREVFAEAVKRNPEPLDIEDVFQGYENYMADIETGNRETPAGVTVAQVRIVLEDLLRYEVS